MILVRLDHWIEWLTPVRFGHIEMTELDNGGPLIFAAADGSIKPRRYGLMISEVNSDAIFDRRSGVVPKLSSLVCDGYNNPIDIGRR